MQRAKFWDRLRYHFDNTMSRGPAGLVLWLALFSVLLVIGVTALVAILGADGDKDFLELLWDIGYQTLTPNPVDPKAGSPIFLAGMFLVTIASLFLVSIFIGILTNAIDHRIQELRKGRSPVIERDHTLILGWSPQIFTIISELIEANANKKNQTVVILAERDKVEMEDELRAKLPDTKTTRLVCRTGSPLDLTDLDVANPHAARAILIVSPEADDPDTQVIKTILALTNHPHRKPGSYHIIAEIRHAKNVEVAKMVGGKETQVVLVSDVISHITVQTCRQSGLSVVYTELLNFEGDEIYFKDEPALVGKAFGSALLAYEDSMVIGLQTKDGNVQLNPPMDTRIVAGDKMIVIAQDDDTIKLSGTTNLGVDENAIQPKPATALVPESTLILGWNSSGATILRELDNYVAPGSQTTVVANLADFMRRTIDTKNQTVKFQEADTTDRVVLEALNVASFHHIIVLSYSDDLDAQQADARTLITLLHLRDISEKTGKEFSIVSEMLDVRNRELAEVTRADDFIVSDQMASLLLAQVAENKHLNAVFEDLFNTEGSEIYLKPAIDYVKIGMPVNFYTIVEAARRRGEVALGYRLKGQARQADKNYGVVLNPKKSNKLAFAPGDKIIVLAEN